MNFNYRLSAILVGTTITSTIILTQPLISRAFDGQELSTKTREITVLINRSDGQNGSGVIISKNEDTYYVLTANHVTRDRENKNGEIKYTVVTHDKKAYEIDYNTVKPISNNLDMAIFEFKSNQEYPVATIVNSEFLAETTPVFVSGWQRPGAVGGDKTIRQLTSSRITTILDEPVFGGYQVGYDNTTLGGMSGGPVVDVEGRLVGIHGLADNDNPENLGLESGSVDKELLKTGFNYGIPINTFLGQTAQAGIFLNLDVVNTPPTELTGAETPVIATDPEKDQIDDLNTVLDDAERIADTIDRGRDILRNLPF
ncbi:Trypsin-like serine protease with C-terminal PDZ domain [Hyella patelloides LEGE 07179]|uniref:Trypsin-like serine protease with C-terminal PDZ domain n=1 Tax=Hyella patelloides LEGE 07179 TaxID=945734 RepID=A0A563VVB4_9CYAN|nr:serine protease [Hyella patelloides]VEP15350.1 Trypsin-like serine protease with C-terminal PDZ domain [Hyella patelloides LEGE 07179]